MHDSRGPTLALRDGERGLIAVCHAGCDRADIMAALRERGLLVGGNDSCRHDPVTVLRGSDSDDATRRTALALRIWDAARDARGTPVVHYLASRGITMPVPLSLRWAPSLRRPDGTYAAAMVARVDGFDGELVGIHRTWLARNDCGKWHRRDRASLGPIAGGAVRLALAAETPMVAEGIETTLSAMQATGLPAWATLSTSGMSALVLLPIVRTVVILADHDANGAGERAAQNAALRWLAGRRVRIAMPAEFGSDFNDVLLGRLCAH